MAIVNTLRPTAVISSSGWTPTGGTASAVTADDSDATYNTWGGVGSPLVLSVGSHTPSAGHARHLVRGRVRGEDGSVVWFVQLANGSLVAPSTAELPAAPATVNGSYDASSSLPLTGATTLAIRVVGQTTGVRTQELYVDVDTREAPTFTPEVYDGSGAENTTVTDTNSPEVGVSALDTDDLQLLRYRYWVTDAGANIVWDTGEVGSGTTPQLSVEPLENGSYTLHIILWSSIGANVPYASDEETLAFTINTTVTQPPESVDIDQVDGEPYFDITVCAPSSMTDWDDDEAYVEIQRTDCNGENVRIAIVGPIGVDECTTYRDWTVTRTLPENCRDDEDECITTWRVRFVGLISGEVATSDWIDDATSYTLDWTSGEHLLRSNTPDGPVYVSVCGTLSWDVDRAFTVNQGIMGARQVFSSASGGHDFSLVMGVRSESELRVALVILNSALTLVSPADSEETWATPVSVDVRVPKTGRVREISVKMRATGSEPVPIVNDVLFPGGGM